MKSLAIFICFVSSFALAGEGTGGDAAHHDWSQVMPQPAANTALSEEPKASKTLEPKFMAKVSGPQTTLKWEAVEGVQYYLQVATDPKFKWLLIDSANMDQTEFELKNLESGKQYFWRVYTQKPGNWPGYTKGPAAKSSFEVK